VRAHLAACLVLVAGAIVTASCAVALGVQNDPALAAAELCDCTKSGGPAMRVDLTDCEKNVEGRLAGASSETRAGWLKDYSDHCAGNCPAWRTCFYEAPACVASGNPCTQNEECCSFPTFPIPLNACQKKELDKTCQ